MGSSRSARRPGPGRLQTGAAGRAGAGPGTHAGRPAGRWVVPAGPAESRAHGGKNVTESTSPVRALWPEPQVLAPPCWNWQRDWQRDRTLASLPSFQRVTRAGRAERVSRGSMPRTSWGHSPSGEQLGAQMLPGPRSEGQLPSRTHTVHRRQASGERDGPAQSSMLPRGLAPTGRRPECRRRGPVCGSRKGPSHLPRTVGSAFMGGMWRDGACDLEGVDCSQTQVLAPIIR